MQYRTKFEKGIDGTTTPLTRGGNHEVADDPASRVVSTAGRSKGDPDSYRRHPRDRWLEDVTVPLCRKKLLSHLFRVALFWTQHRHLPSPAALKLHAGSD